MEKDEICKRCGKKFNDNGVFIEIEKCCVLGYVEHFELCRNCYNLVMKIINGKGEV